MSRRGAFRRFGSVLAASALAFVTGKQASADDDGRGAICDGICTAFGNCGFRNHGQCVSTCVHTGTVVNGVFNANNFRGTFCGCTECGDNKGGDGARENGKNNGRSPRGRQ
jgi:hypothetical protein